MTDQNKERAEHAGDPRVSQRYRELGAEEPPRALDDAILAAARREAGARPGSPGRAAPQRWHAPLAAAAVLVLAVAVTLNMQIERPGIESPVAEVQLKQKAEVQLGSAAREAAKEAVKRSVAEEAKITRRKSAEQPAPAVTAVPEPRPFAADQAAASAAARSDESRGAASNVTGALARPLEERTSRDAQVAARAPQAGPVQAKRAESAERAEAPANLQAQRLADTPERELERIAELRGQGRHDEADRALAEFRKRYPDYRIPDAMRERIERR